MNADDRELGGIAKYELRFSLPGESAAELGEQPFWYGVTQLVVLLDDAEAARRLMTKTRPWEDFKARWSPGSGRRPRSCSRTQKHDPTGSPTTTRTSTSGLVDSSAVWAHRRTRTRGLLQLRKLADAFLSMMESVLREEAKRRREPCCAARRLGSHPSST
jgi:hypothetical protein